MPTPIKQLFVYMSDVLLENQGLSPSRSLKKGKGYHGILISLWVRPAGLNESPGSINHFCTINVWMFLSKGQAPGICHV
jgi:hypothetical protein